MLEKLENRLIAPKKMRAMDGIHGVICRTLIKQG